jgi:hypothetical protein
MIKRLFAITLMLFFSVNSFAGTLKSDIKSNLKLNLCATESTHYTAIGYGECIDVDCGGIGRVEEKLGKKLPENQCITQKDADLLFKMRFKEADEKTSQILKEKGIKNLSKKHKEALIAIQFFTDHLDRFPNLLLLIKKGDFKSAYSAFINTNMYKVEDGNQFDFIANRLK